MARKSLGRKLRFEVFKRDGFKCQYCGGAAPDVVLHVDHIKPVAAGGDDDLMNLVTACQPCNSGKGARELSDKTAVEKQRLQLDALHARREQLDMMMEWKFALVEGDHSVAQKLADFWCQLAGWEAVKPGGVEKLRKNAKKFGFEAVLDAMQIAADSYSDTKEGFNKIGGICFNTKRDASLSDEERLIHRCRSILRKRIYVNEGDVLERLRLLLKQFGQEPLREYCFSVRNWTALTEDSDAVG